MTLTAQAPPTGLEPAPVAAKRRSFGVGTVIK